MWKKTSLAILALSLTTAAQAAIEPVFKFGVEVGGDTLVDTTTEDMNAGGGLYFGAGINVTGDTPDDLIYRATIGYLFDDIEFIPAGGYGRGEASTNAIPLNLGIYKLFNEHHEFGVGLAYYINPTYEVSASGCGYPYCGTADYDNALGFTVEYTITSATVLFSVLNTPTWTTREMTITPLMPVASGFISAQASNKTIPNAMPIASPAIHQHGRFAWDN